jgi:hypothetical protein
VKVAASINPANLIPGNNVTDALADLEMAVWADPGFPVIGICANAGLGGVLDSALDLTSTQTEANSTQIQIFNRLRLRLSPTWTVTARH